ncbi:MAG TPA: hypothetical protein VF503_19865 [Sphingobium sp.]|uniref:hypothetical protein n=1 Tax=Sphingobium sp. TaxID=1912891 RepID=UPI002ED0FEFB
MNDNALPSFEEIIAQIPANGRLFGSDVPSGFERMDVIRFDALALWGLPQDFRERFVPISYWSADQERLLAVIYQEAEPSEIGLGISKVGLGIIGRDEHGRYRPFAHQKSFPSARAAEDALRGNNGRDALGLTPKFPTLDDQPQGTDLFSPIKGVKALHPAFEYLRDGITQRAAKELLTELSKWVPDLDGNLARDFQTTGYSARVWELYLLFAFREMNFRVANEHSTPDFHLAKGGNDVFVEATTVNSADPMAAGILRGKMPQRPEDIWQFIEGEMPLKFGSPLHSKMAKRYWEQSHVRGKPFVMAIADFHGPGSMIWSHTAIPVYLYGRSANVTYDEHGQVHGVEKTVDTFAKGDTSIIPFFDQPDVEHVSAVLSSNAGTISKFNRMGVRAGFGDRFVRLQRSGGWHDPQPDAFEAISFEFDIEDPQYREDWSDELALYHNPNALRPIDDDLFPGITHFRIENGEAIWRGPAPRVLYSTTITLDLLGRERETGLSKPRRRRAKK